ncbi:MAG: 50S ribosomal protein L13 [Methanomicrobiales archaeon]|jgi:large subunit ribosomal protein L13|nr:rpl13p [Methanomicrobia archaeon]MDD1634179.1 50S ribosomal protein L13 [Methanomicrobiales archaeon]MDD1638700.1 50S ribosomal protein L13 [Methanomicrobiales archaeon]MDD1645031.1 50S ribosomal protein L13 [Methanomicrobiales archaeon]MDD1646311.1 50S ribosomal protein L13 [Methanomicrobiales archaeon]
MAVVVNAEGMILGRMASLLAHRLMAGEEIAVVNAEKAVISGTKARVFAIYEKKRSRGSREGGPFFPRRPDHLVKRTIRGMLPYKREPGREAFHRVKVYVGVPPEFAGKEMESFPEAHVSRLSSPRYVTVGAVSTFMGAKYGK